MITVRYRWVYPRLPRGSTVTHGSPQYRKWMVQPLALPRPDSWEGFQTDRRDENLRRSGEAVGGFRSSSQQPCGGHWGPPLAGWPPPMGSLPTLHRCPIDPLVSFDQVINLFTIFLSLCSFARTYRVYVILLSVVIQYRKTR